MRSLSCSKEKRPSSMALSSRTSSTIFGSFVRSIGILCQFAGGTAIKMTSKQELIHSNCHQNGVASFYLPVGSGAGDGIGDAAGDACGFGKHPSGALICGTTGCGGVAVIPTSSG